MIELLVVAILIVTLQNILLQRRLQKLESLVKTEGDNIEQLWEVVQPEDNKFLGKDGAITDLPAWLEKAA